MAQRCVFSPGVWGDPQAAYWGILCHATAVIVALPFYRSGRSSHHLSQFLLIPQADVLHWRLSDGLRSFPEGEHVMQRLATLTVVTALILPAVASGQDYSFGDWARDQGYEPGDVMPDWCTGRPGWNR